MNEKPPKKIPKYQKDFNSLWKITGDVDDYFRRLGGAGCYSGFADWHVPALILLLLTGLDPKREDFLKSADSYLLHPDLWRSTDNLPIKTLEDLSNMKISAGLFHLYLNAITKRLSEMSKQPEELLGWMRFMIENDERFREYYR